MRSPAVPAPIPRSALYLGLGGLVPLVTAALSQWMAISLISPATGLAVGIAGGAAILSFQGGIRWGTAIGPLAARHQSMEFVTSVLPALCGWLALLLPSILGLGLLISGFLMQALWDVASVEDGRLPLWFGRLRMMLTIVAVISLIVMLLRQLS